MLGLIGFLIITGWQSQTSNVNADLFDIDCVSATQCWAVGAAGTIIHTTDGGQNWITQTSGTSEDLFGVDFVDELNGWATGYGPTILHTTDGGNSWNQQTPNTSNDLLDIAFANSNRGWATGVSGTIIGTTDGGNSWNSEISGQWAWLWGITVISPTDAWATGADWFNHISPIYHYDGASWSQQYEITATQNGKAASSVNPTVAWVVGGDGVIYKTTDGGANWSEQTSGVSSTLFSISTPSTLSCWIAGASGIILHTSDGGNVWSQQECPSSDSLYGISMWDDLTGWIVGENGLILYTNDGGAGIKELSDISSSSPIAIFPNPAKTEINLSLAKSFIPYISVDLTDVTGRIKTHLYRGAAQRSLHFSVSNLAAGTYFVIITTDKDRLIQSFTKLKNN